jgi:myo-inositol 2-dehydrogenase/D-chiro-inositol 1-dehydrogenase
MTDTRLCIVGAGNHSSGFVTPKIGSAGAELVGVCDLDREKAERNARRWGGTPYTDIDTMLDEQDPDGVVIVVGGDAYVELAPKVLERGIPVYTEKPPAPTAEEALKLARLADEAGVLYSTGMKQRYATVYDRAKRWIESFESEQKYSIALTRGLGDYGQGGGVLLGSGIHSIDLLQYLFGEVDQVMTFSKGKQAYAVTMQFVDGAVGTFEINDGRSFEVPSEDMEITLEGGNFMSIHNSCEYHLTEDGTPSEWHEPPVWIAPGDLGHETGLLTELVAFVDAIENGESTRSTIYDSYKSMELYEAIGESAETGQPTDVTYERL